MRSQDLIERLKRYMASRGFPAQHESEIIAMVEAALTPVLPEDVQALCKDLRDWAGPELGATYTGEYILHNAADLIERLARENIIRTQQLNNEISVRREFQKGNAQWTEDFVQFRETLSSIEDELKKAQQRIEELTQSRDTYFHGLNDKLTQIAEYEKALTNMAKSPQGFDGYWKDFASAELKRVRGMK